MPEPSPDKPDPIPPDDLVGMIYQELRRLAAQMMRRQRRDHTLQPTALANEVIGKLLSGSYLTQNLSRDRLFAAAVEAMKQVLIDYERKRRSRKRGGLWIRHPLEIILDRLETTEGVRFEALNSALEQLAELEPRQHLVVTLHCFMGMTHNEVADRLGISVKTVEKDWRWARAWLLKTLREQESHG